MCEAVRVQYIWGRRTSTGQTHCDSSSLVHASFRSTSCQPLGSLNKSPRRTSSTSGSRTCSANVRNEQGLYQSIFSLYLRSFNESHRMNSLFLAWQAPTRAFFPVGLLNADRARSHYVFQYTNGALRAKKLVGFQALPAFPKLRARYEASELFPLFKNRVLDPSRRDFADYLRSLDLDPQNPDPIEILAISGGARQTDSLEVFPKIEKSQDNTFACRFFLQ